MSNLYDDLNTIADVIDTCVMALDTGEDYAPISSTLYFMVIPKLKEIAEELNEREEMGSHAWRYYEEE